MISRLLVNNNHVHKTLPVTSSPFFSDSEDEDYIEARSTRKHKSKQRLRQARYLEMVRWFLFFKRVMLVGLCTIQDLVKDGKDPKPLYKHLEFMAKEV